MDTSITLQRCAASGHLKGARASESDEKRKEHGITCLEEVALWRVVDNYGPGEVPVEPCEVLDMDALHLLGVVPEVRSRHGQK